MALHAPTIDPVILRLWGPLQIRWYSLLYVGGFLVGRWIIMRIAREDRFKFTPSQVDDLLMPGLIGAVIGARIFYCLFYDFSTFVANPIYLFQIYRGGLSFHGALIGLMIASALYARKRSIPILSLWDGIAIAGTPGLAMGRLGNFINGELWGRVTTVPWGMIFPSGGPEPRHPSQLYELFLEGVVLFFLVYSLRNKLKKDGQISLLFLLGYPTARFIVEFFRQPDAQLGFLAFGLSMGQWLCVGMFVVSFAGFLYISRKQEKPAIVVPIKNSFQKKQDQKRKTG